MAYEQGIGSASTSAQASAAADFSSLESLVGSHTRADGSLDATGLGAALADSTTTLEDGREDRVKAVLDAVDPDQRAAVADAFIEAAGADALAEMAGTLDGQHALQALHGAAGADGQAALAEVERNLNVCPAVDFAGVYSAPAQPPGDTAAQKQELLLDLTQIGLAVAGIVDPTPISDGLDGLISLGRGDWLGAGISVASMIPYVGDLSKVGKLEKFAEAITRAVDIARTDTRFAEQLRPVLEPIRDALNAVSFDSLPGIVREPLQTMKNKVDEFFDAAATGRSRLPDFADGARHVDPETGRPVIDARSGTTGDWNRSINSTLEPDVIYRTDTGYLYHTDAQGRIVHVEGELIGGTAARNTYQQGVAGGSDRLPSDQGGHLIASVFSGPGERLNIVPMDANLNMSAWKTMENTWSSALASGEQVQVSIRPIYSGDSLRPDSFAVRYTIGDGRPVTEFFNNRPGG